jgi:hypothetical protein
MLLYKHKLNFFLSYKKYRNRISLKKNSHCVYGNQSYSTKQFICALKLEKPKNKHGSEDNLNWFGMFSLELKNTQWKQPVKLNTP